LSQILLTENREKNPLLSALLFTETVKLWTWTQLWLEPELPASFVYWVLFSCCWC